MGGTSRSHAIAIVAAEVYEESPEEVARKEALLEDRIRRRIMEEAVEANLVPEVEPATPICQSRKTKRALWILPAGLLVVVVGVLVGKLLTGSDHDDVSTTKDWSRPTIETIRERGHVKCGVIFQSDGSNVTAMESINIEQCRALSTAVFGSPDRVEIKKLGASRQKAFVVLKNHSVDVLTALSTHSMSRDVFEPLPQTGLTFSVPYAYIGAIFAGESVFVDCAERLDGSTGACRDLKLCTFQGTLFENILKTEILRGVEVFASPDIAGIEMNLKEGVCNAAFADKMLLPQSLIGTSQDFKFGTVLFSHESCGCTTRDDDAEWSNLVNLVINTFYSAEAANVTTTNADKLHSYLPHNTELAAMLVSVVSQIGNYADIAADFSNLLPREGLNRLYGGSHSGTGLLYSFFFGTVDSEGPAPLADKTLERIIKRDRLICGVRPRAGFATLDESVSGNASSWAGFDVEFCRAIAAAILRDGKSKVTFVNVTAANDMYANLNAGEVDLVAGARVTLEAGYHEPVTGRAYTFSMPYFYESDTRDGYTRDAYAMMTRQDDPQWSDFVYWIINGLVFAEERQITHSNSTEMPIVFLFGGSLKQMFLDSVAAVGSYGDIYKRTLETVLPRSPPNTLNGGMDPQQFPLPFS